MSETVMLFFQWNHRSSVFVDCLTHLIIYLKMVFFFSFIEINPSLKLRVLQNIGMKILYILLVSPKIFVIRTNNVSPYCRNAENES